MKECPFCYKDIEDLDTKCPHCRTCFSKVPGWQNPCRPVACANGDQAVRMDVEYEGRPLWSGWK